MYDLVIIGAGPAGLTASIYASCYHLKHLVIGRELGGQLILAPDILNYPGFDHISGKELAKRMVDQVKLRGGEVVVGDVVKISKDQDGKGFEVETKEGGKYQSQSIIIATGTERRKLGVAGEIEYTAKGVRYCATCEKFDYKGKICAVVGGANSAVQAAVELSQAASKVYIIYRGFELRGDQVWIEQIGKKPNIEVIYNSTVSEIIGDGKKVTGVKIKSTNQPINQSTNGKLLTMDKVFIEIGGVPGTALVIPLGVTMDLGGYIRVDKKLATNVPGIFAAGDLVSNELSIEQISSAVGLGARAAASVFAYVKQGNVPTVWGESQIKRMTT